MIRHHNAKTIFYQLLSVLLSLSMFSSVLTGSITVLATGVKTASASCKTQKSIGAALQSAAMLTSAMQLDQKVDFENPDIDNSSHQWDSIIGNFEMFVYGLLISELQNLYEVFNGEITLPDGTEVYGIGFTDFDTYFEANNGSGFFPAGFIPLIGEADISEDAKESGLEIRNVDLIETGVSFVLAYDTEPFLQHCVIWNHYLQYGIDEDGGITYTAQEYVRGHCNEELGALYSYDERRFVFDPNVGNYKYIAGQSLYTPVDYAALEAEVNRILSEQDINFSMVEVRTAVYTAQEAFTNYLLSLQEESFMGYPVSEIIQIAEQLDPMELIRFTPEGHIIINIADEIPDSADALTKWLTGIRIGITIVCSITPLIMPAFAPFAGIISMASCNVFSQILDENKNLSDINWKKVALSAVSGAMIAWAIPTASGNVTYNLIHQGINEGASKLAGYALQGISSGLTHGITNAVSAFLDSKELPDVWDTFLITTTQTAAISLVFSGMFELFNPAIESITENIFSNLQNTITNNPNGWLAKLSNKIRELDIHPIHFTNETLDRFLTPRSVYEAAKEATRELNIQASFLDAALSQMPNNENFNYYTSDGQLIPKEQIDITKMKVVIRPSENCDPKVLAYFTQNGISEIPVINGTADLSAFSLYTFKPDDGITSQIDINFPNFYKQLAEQWKANPSEIPSQIRVFLPNSDITIIDKGIVKNLLKQAKITLHEGADGSVYLIDTFIHQKISHAGGRALAAKQENITTAIDYLKWLISGVEPAIMESTATTEANK